MRPATLAEVAELAAQGDSFDRCLANFLDGFYASPNAAALVPTPTLLAPAQGKIGKVQDAYLAATAEDLALRFSLPLPSWTRGEERQLHELWFATTLASVRAAVTFFVSVFPALVVAFVVSPAALVLHGLTNEVTTRRPDGRTSQCLISPPMERSANRRARSGPQQGVLPGSFTSRE